MSERDHFLCALIKEVLGPRQGPHKILSNDQDPRNEYITGVIAPRAARERPDIEAEAELLEEAGETSGEEDLDDPPVIAAPMVSFSPALDPKALPHSIGLSFVIESLTDNPSIEVCATWARYCHPPASRDWQRSPGHLLTGPISTDSDRVWTTGLGVMLYLRTRQVGLSSQRRVSLYLVNTTEPHDQNRISTEEMLFQPQLRVHCVEGTKIVPLPGGPLSQLSGGERSEEDDSIVILYRERRPMARGHLCGATWMEIDPERPHPDIHRPDTPPYAWADGVVVPSGERAKFSPADVRTELVPCYPVETPDMGWQADEHPSAPTLDPEQLAELWRPEDIRAALTPIADAYAAWINSQRRQLASLDPALSTVGQRHLMQCERALERIRGGIRACYGLCATTATNRCSIRQAKAMKCRPATVCGKRS